MSGYGARGRLSGRARGGTMTVVRPLGDCGGGHDATPERPPYRAGGSGPVADEHPSAVGEFSACAHVGRRRVGQGEGDVVRRPPCGPCCPARWSPPTPRPGAASVMPSPPGLEWCSSLAPRRPARRWEGAGREAGRTGPDGQPTVRGATTPTDRGVGAALAELTLASGTASRATWLRAPQEARHGNARWPAPGGAGVGRQARRLRVRGGSRRGTGAQGAGVVGQRVGRLRANLALWRIQPRLRCRPGPRDSSANRGSGRPASASCWLGRHGPSRGRAYPAGQRTSA